MLHCFSKNSLGKDYICSDIHGHFSILQEALNNLGFDEQHDRLFSLGDLIDRGDESHLALEWLAKPWFFAIQGNHERMLINTVEQESETLRRQWLMWGGDWAEDMDFDRLRPYYEAFSKLPIAIELELINGNSVSLVHAELPDECDWSKVKDLLLNIDRLKVEAIRETSDMLWNKIQPYSSPEKMALVGNVKNIYHVFHGHSIVEDYLTIANRTFMDLGAYKTTRIGIICPSDFI
ncbi:MAG: metallophosphoesterase [Pseudomonadota bacterium]